MGAFTETIEIDASPTRVWEVLADLRGIQEWNPGVKTARLVSEEKSGIGAQRYCGLTGDEFVREEVIEWSPLERLTMRVIETDLPLSRADIQFTLKGLKSGTLVRVRPEYDVKYGLLGPLLDALVVRRKYARGMRALLHGLRKHCESGGGQ